MSAGDPYDDPWYSSWELINARAWWLLERSAQVRPRLSPDARSAGTTRILYWDDAMGWTDSNPTTITVFEPWESDVSQCTVREATWLRARDLDKLKERATQSGRTEFMEPTIAIRDGQVLRCELFSHLASIARIVMPAIPMHTSGALTTDVGSCGFEFFTNDQPPASIRLEWSFDKPSEWIPIIDEVCRFLDQLRGCLR